MKRDKFLAPISGDVRAYEAPLCSVYEITVEDTILSNTPGKPGDYDSDNDIIIDDEF